MSVDPQTQGDGRHVPLSAYAEQGVVLVAKSNGEVVAVSLADLGFTVDTDENGELTVVSAGGGGGITVANPPEDENNGYTLLVGQDEENNPGWYAQNGSALETGITSLDNADGISQLGGILTALDGAITTAQETADSAGGPLKGAYIGTVTGTPAEEGATIELVINEAQVYAYEGDDSTQDMTHDWFEINDDHTIRFLEPGRYVINYYWQVQLDGAAQVRAQVTGNSGPMGYVAGAWQLTLKDTIVLDLFESYTYPNIFGFMIDIPNGAGRFVSGGLFAQVFKLS